MKHHVANNPFLIGFIYFTHYISWLLKFLASKKRNKESVRSVLISNIAHFGDVVLSTSVIPQIKKHYPEVKIGFLTSSYSAQILKNHPEIDHIYVLDHPKLNRQLKGLLGKWMRFFRMFFMSLREIKKNRYDVFIDLYPYYPNTSLLSFLCKIPKRMGFTTGGYRFCLTDSYHFENDYKHMTKWFESLLMPMGIYETSSTILTSYLPIHGKSSEFFQDIKQKICKPYVVIHPYSGDEKKNWNVESWIQVVKELKEKDYDLVFTGSKKDLDRFHQEFNSVKEDVIVTMGSLSFEEIKMCLKNARLLISVDTFIVHLTLEHKVKCVVIKSYPQDAILWDPISENHIVIKAENRKEKTKRTVFEKIPTQRVLEGIFKLLD